MMKRISSPLDDDGAIPIKKPCISAVEGGPLDVAIQNDQVMALGGKHSDIPPICDELNPEGTSITLS
jgi:hypothetical protein